MHVLDMCTELTWGGVFRYISICPHKIIICAFVAVSASVAVAGIGIEERLKWFERNRKRE